MPSSFHPFTGSRHPSALNVFVTFDFAWLQCLDLTMRPRRVLIAVGVVVLSACGARPATGFRPCPDAADAPCVLFAPAESGLGGEGATVDQLAVRPAASPRGQLLVFLNGSGGAPLSGEPLLRVARREGLHALALSYRSSQAIGVLCQGADACFEPARLALVTGERAAGAPRALDDVARDEGIEVRLLAALRLLDGRDAEGAWSQFLSSDQTAVRWDLVIVSGHSQGGGHAALLAKRHRVRRVLMLASPCDARSDGAPASWLSDAIGWATDPRTAFFGVWAPGDTTCPAAPQIWSNLGVPSSAQDAMATVCRAQGPHVAPLTCTENEAAWLVALR
jgi:pimeloyl-ACP methyl ester carboxylesterase